MAKSFSKRELLAICGVFLASVLVYIPTLHHGFVWDDVLVLSSQIHGMKGYHLFLGGGDYYRPFLALAHGLDYALWGSHPFGFHLTNILLNAFCASLVFILAVHLLGEEQFFSAVAVSLLFVLNPIHADSVAWVAGRTDIIAALFFFLAFLSYIAYRKYNDPKGLVLSALFFLFSLFGKEVGILLPLVLFFYDLLIERKKIRATFLPFFVNFGVICLYFALRNVPNLRLQAATGVVAHSRSGQIHDLVTVALDIMYSLGFYFKKMLLPVRLTIFPDIHSYANLTAFTAFSGLFVFLIYKYVNSRKMAQVSQSDEDLIHRRTEPGVLGERIISPPLTGEAEGEDGVSYFVNNKAGNRANIFLFGLIFVLATILPSLPVLFIGVPTPVAIRYLYLAVFGVSLAVVWSIGRIQIKTLRFFLLAGLIVLYAVGLDSRNADWKNDLSLWRYEVSKNPDSATARSLVAVAFFVGRDYRQSENEINYILKNIDCLRLRKSLRRNLLTSLYNTLGLICFERNDLRGAEKNFTEALGWDDKNRSAYHNLGSIYLSQYQEHNDRRLLRRANLMYGRAAKIDTLYINAKYGLAYTSQLLGEKDEATKYYKEVIALDPGGDMARMAWRSLVAMGVGR